MSKIRNTETFIKKAVEIHGEKYDYSLAEYTKAHSQIEIICPVHGSFWAKACNHIHCQSGCPKCAGKNKTLEERFWEKVDKNGPTMDHMSTACWKWTGSKFKNGYGGIKEKNTKNISAHVLSYMLHYGVDPRVKSLHTLHKCDYPPCTNPEHLFLGTPADNTRDRQLKSRARKIKLNRQEGGFF